MSIPEYDIRARDVPADLFPDGRCRFSLGAGSTRLQAARRASMHKLRAEWGAWDVLKAVEGGVVAVQEAHRAVTDLGQGALPELRQTIAERRSGPVNVPTLGEAVESYLAWYAEQDRRPKSMLNAESQARAILDHLDPGTPIDRLGQEEAESGVRRLKDGTPAAHNTIRNRAGRLMSVLKHAHTMERDQARKEGRPVAWQLPDVKLKIEQQKARVRYANRHEAMALIQHAAPYQEAYLRSFLHLGLRASELIHTRIGADLDVDRWTWKIQPRKGWKPKTALSRRELDVPAVPTELRASILRYLKLSATSDYVFRNPRTSERWDINTLARDFKALCKLAGVVYGEKRGGLTLHSLRHTFGTNLVQVADVTYVAALMGNTVEECSRTYVHPSRKELAAAIARSEPYE